jgi:basic membrane protein A
VGGPAPCGDPYREAAEESALMMAAEPVTKPKQAAKDKGTHIIGSYTDRCGSDPLYVAYSITGVGFQVEYAIDQAVSGSWKPGYKEFGLQMGPQASDMIVCGGTPEQKTKLDAIKKDILSGKIKVLKG